MVDNIKRNWDFARWSLNSLKYGMRWATGGATIGWVFWNGAVAINAASVGFFLGCTLAAIWEIKRCQQK